MFLRDYREFLRQRAASHDEFAMGPLLPLPGDRFAPGGVAKGHYFHQDLLVARRIFEHGPEIHIDVGSRVDGFVAHVAAFRSIKVVDIRPIRTTLKNIEFVKADLMGDLPPDLIGGCDSLSCLHALEHFGLGRFGDDVRFDGHLLGLRNLTRMLRQKGTLYLSVPIGRQQVQFNAHRIFSAQYILDITRADFELRSLSLVDDAGDLHEDVTASAEELTSSFGYEYGCGIFELVKH